MNAPHDPALSQFPAAIRALLAGDFTRLEPLFQAPAGIDSSIIVKWYRQGLFQSEPEALLEAFTCACFLGSTEIAAFLLDAGVPPSGGAATGLNALHWAAGGGHVEVVELLLSHGVPLETRNMYGGTPLGQAVWSAVHEPRPGQVEAIAALVSAGARVSEIAMPTGRPDVDAVLRGQ